MPSKNSFTHDTEGKPLSEQMQKFVYAQFLEKVEFLSKRGSTTSILSGFKKYYPHMVVIGEDTRRVYIRINDLLVKISRTTRVQLENTAEEVFWVKSLNTKYRPLLNPVTYVSENKRILVAPYIICFASSAATEGSYLEFERKMQREYDLYLTYPEGTAYDLSLIVHYPYYHAYPKGFVTL